MTDDAEGVDLETLQFDILAVLAEEPRTTPEIADTLDTQCVRTRQAADSLVGAEMVATDTEGWVLISKNTGEPIPNHILTEKGREILFERAEWLADRGSLDAKTADANEQAERIRELEAENDDLREQLAEHDRAPESFRGAALQSDISDIGPHSRKREIYQAICKASGIDVGRGSDLDKLEMFQVLTALLEGEDDEGEADSSAGDEAYQRFYREETADD